MEVGLVAFVECFYFEMGYRGWGTEVLGHSNAIPAPIVVVRMENGVAAAA